METKKKKINQESKEDNVMSESSLRALRALTEKLRLQIA